MATSIQCIDDTLITTASAGFGASPTLLCGNQQVFSSHVPLRCLFRFDLTNLPAELSRAQLTLTPSGGTIPSASTFYIAKLAPSWLELEATWLKRDSLTNWLQPGGDLITPPAASTIISTASDLLIFDIPLLANDMAGGMLDVILYGVEGEAFSRFVQIHSRESATISARPRLDLLTRASLSIQDSPVTNLAIADWSCAT